MQMMGFASLYPSYHFRVVRVFDVIASEAKQSISPLAEKWIASSLPLLAMTGVRLPIYMSNSDADMRQHSRGAIRPSFCHFHPRKAQRAQGRPGARCTRGLVCKHAQKNAHEHTGSAETLRPSPRNGFTAYSVLSPVTGFLATVAAQTLPRNLTPASGRQDHTTSPSASRALVFRAHRGHRISPQRS